MRIFWNRMVFAAVAAIVLLPINSRRSEAEVLYYSFNSYLTGQDPYNSNPNFGSTDFAIGTTSVTLGFSGAGPLGGVFSFSGSAEAAVGSLKTEVANTLTDYPVGSYYNVSTPVFDYLPESGVAQALVKDQVVINGGDATYDVEFTYRLTGVSARGDGIFDSYFRPVVFTGTTFLDTGTFTTVGFDGTSFYPQPGLLDTTLVLTVNDIPANTVFDLQQMLQVRMFAADSQYSTDIDPFQTGDWDPVHIVSQETLIGAGPYTVSYYADLGNSLELQNVAVLDDAGNVAAGATLISQNGVVYPGQPVGEPSTLLLLCAGLASLSISGRRRPRLISHLRDSRSTRRLEDER
jgi:hypothetical protein